jgi:hypothetical protein
MNDASEMYESPVSGVETNDEEKIDLRRKKWRYWNTIQNSPRKRNKESIANTEQPPLQCPVQMRWIGHPRS